MMSRICLRQSSQDGVCGCLEFWKPTAPKLQDTTSIGSPSATEASDTLGLRTTSNLNDLLSVSPTPSGPPKETCFFWYHGTCRRGEQCHVAHETHVTWPIPPPPGFVHYKACRLPLCPLREDLLALSEARKAHRCTSQLSGQVDGTTFSKTTALEPALSEDGDADTVSSSVEDVPKEPGVSLLVSDIAPSESGTDLFTLEGDDVNKVVTMSETADPTSVKIYAPTCNFPTLASTPPTSDSMDYIEVSNTASPPPSSENGDQAILSLSHSGTRDKRKRQQTLSPGEQTPDSKLTKREPAPELSDFASILEPKRRITHWDLEPFTPDVVAIRPKPKALQADPSYGLLQHPISALSGLSVPDHRSTSPKPRSFDPPKGPRALSDTSPICFHWYHKGHCRPKQRNGQATKCNYTHSLDVPHRQVSLPPHITNHGPCQLEFCPLRSQGQGAPHCGEQGSRDMLKTTMKIEPYRSSSSGVPFEDRYKSSSRDVSPMGRYSTNMQLPRPDEFSRKSDAKQPSRANYGRNKKKMSFYNRALERDPEPSNAEAWAPSEYEPAYFEENYSSSPRDTISSARYEAGVKGPKFDKLDRRPKAKQLPKLTGVARERFKEQKQRIEQWQAERGIRPDDPNTRREKQMAVNKRRRVNKRQKRLDKGLVTASMLKAENDSLLAMSANVPGTYSRPDAIATPAKGSHKLPRGRRAESVFEDEQAMGEELATNDPEAGFYRKSARHISGFPKSATPLDVQHVASGEEGSVQEHKQVQGVIQKDYAQVARKTSVLVDYELPEGEARLEWDTDLVRRLFGEIA
ncbi:uncharacterized protein K460DRAFT_351619 [Cucurbitaria berberidis CBS 394.84]|uniref:C3H1-type domain-containing protein n=1 Tax=Cucurbitaria berberidis CBS 394.84 TaxID=1168544 RepID=A0A9P4LE64_9PLEO|nr:uncharacterized protein K460DRAFT_351619 [Cucurbitaria berberidis CBS 394.84]KAF1851720.1 hypothetical protein K460DRAFT_351619 [Cucurbitaria berberidis CBS 394.84]